MGAPASPVSESIANPNPRRVWAVGPAFDNLRRNALMRWSQLAWALALLFVIPIADTRPASVQAMYDHADELFLHGDLINTQQEAEQGYRRFRDSNREWAAKFQ